MVHAPTSERLAAALRKAQRQWRRELEQGAREMPPLPKAPLSPPRTITISREAGTHAHEIAEKVAQRLGWVVYDCELIEHIARKAQLRAELISHLDEQPLHKIRDYLRWHDPTAWLSAGKYFQHLLEVLAGISGQGSGVIIGRGANLALPVDRTVSVRLVAPLQDRINSYVARHGLTEAQAKQRIEELDSQRAAFIQDHFRRNVADPCLYDMVLNVSRLTQDQCAELIVVDLKRLQSPEAGTHS